MIVLDNSTVDMGQALLPGLPEQGVTSDKRYYQRLCYILRPWFSVRSSNNQAVVGLMKQWFLGSPGRELTVIAMIVQQL